MPFYLAYACTAYKKVNLKVIASISAFVWNSLESGVNEVVAMAKLFQHLMAVYDLHDSFAANQRLLHDLLTAMKV